MKKLWILILGVGVLPLSTAHALSVTPARTEARLIPGDKTKVIVQVTNDGVDPVDVAWETKDWFVLPANKALPVEQWLKVKMAPNFRLKPGKTKKVKVIVTCPKETQGELVGMLSFAFQSGKLGNILPVVSNSFYSIAIGREEISGKITRIWAHRASDRVQIGVGVLSTGNVHLRPSGKVEITDSAGKQISSMVIKEGEPAYPGSERGFFTELKGNSLSAGHYLIKVEMNYRELVLRGTKEFDVDKEGNIPFVPGLQSEFSSAPGTSNEKPKEDLKAK